MIAAAFKLLILSVLAAVVKWLALDDDSPYDEDDMTNWLTPHERREAALMEAARDVIRAWDSWGDDEGSTNPLDSGAFVDAIGRQKTILATYGGGPAVSAPLPEGEPAAPDSPIDWARKQGPTAAPPRPDTW